jgi:hypothetical protein
MNRKQAINQANSEAFDICIIGGEWLLGVNYRGEPTERQVDQNRVEKSN